MLKSRAKTAGAGVGLVILTLIAPLACRRGQPPSPELMQHRGRAVVFNSIEHYKERVDDPELDIDASCIMVLQNCGPRGYPGMAEIGKALVARGVPTARIRTAGFASRRPVASNSTSTYRRRCLWTWRPRRRSR